MTAADQARYHLVDARVALFEADLALAMGNPGAARVQIQLAQAYLVEISKDLGFDSSPRIPSPRPQTPDPGSKNP